MTQNLSTENTFYIANRMELESPKKSMHKFDISLSVQKKGRNTEKVCSPHSKVEQPLKLEPPGTPPRRHKVERNQDENTKKEEAKKTDLPDESVTCLLIPRDKHGMDYDVTSTDEFTTSEAVSKRRNTKLDCNDMWVPSLGYVTRQRRQRHRQAALAKMPSISYVFFFTSQIKICLTACRYESIRRVASVFGMREVNEDAPWNFYWTDLSVSLERAKEMNRFQRVNHFPGMLEICRKDLLARNLNRMQKIYPKEYNFFPKTWCFPLNEAITYSKTRKNKTYIIKPECGSQGRGIYLTKSLKEIRPTDKLICQVYVAKPYLVDGYKFDIRVYALITSCDPLRIFVYNEGLVRFATSHYADPNLLNSTNFTNVFMHLTNYAINKHSRTYVNDAQAGSKRKISTLNKILKSQGVDMDKLWHNIDQVIVKTVISAWPVLKHSYHACFPTHDLIPACFEILGFDILLDHRLHPYILEVNHSPSFHTDTQLDREVKEALLIDTFSILNIWQCDKRRQLEENKRAAREKYCKYVPVYDSTMQQHTRIAEYEAAPEPEKPRNLSQIQWEESHLGNFRRVYPVSDKYLSLIRQTPEDKQALAIAIASKAKGDYLKLQQEEQRSSPIELEPPRRPLQLRILEEQTPTFSILTDKEKTERFKAREKELKKKEKEKAKLAQHELALPAAAPKVHPPVVTAPPTPPPPPPLTPPRKPASPKPAYVSRSFEPDPIVPTEERARANLMAQRDFLIRSYGLLEMIYLVMKKVGTLKPVDERKYGCYGMLQTASYLPKIQSRLLLLEAE